MRTVRHRIVDTGGPAHEPGLDARLGRLESDVSDIRTVLNRLTPRIDEMYGFLTVRLPQSATNAELTGLRAETRTQIVDLAGETKTEFADVRRQSIFDIFAIVGLTGVILTIAARFAH